MKVKYRVPGSWEEVGRADLKKLPLLSKLFCLRQSC